MKECIFCDEKGIEKYGKPGDFIGGKYAGVQAYACKDHALAYPRVGVEKIKGMRMGDIVVERQARRDFSNKYYCGY